VVPKMFARKPLETAGEVILYRSELIHDAQKQVSKYSLQQIFLCNDVQYDKV